MDTSNDFYINDIGATLAKALEPLIEYQKQLAETMRPIMEIMRKIGEQLKEFFEQVNELLSEHRTVIEEFNFQMIKTIAPVASEICVDDVAPRAPPLQSFKEKIEIRFLYFGIKYEKCIYSLAKTILENESYNLGRDVFVFLIRRIFGF